MIPIFFYWDGELEPFTALDKGCPVEDLPTVGDQVMVRDITLPATADTVHHPAVVLHREFDLLMKSNSDTCIFAHRLVLAVTNK